MRAFNLLPKEDLRERKGGGRLKPAYVAVALAGVLAVGGVGALYMNAGAGLSEKRAEVSQLRSELAAAQQPERKLPASADPQLVQERDNRTAAVADVLAGRVAWDRMLRDLALVIPKTAYTWQVVGQPPAEDAVTTGATGTRSLEIDGCAENHDDIAEFLVRLQAVPEFATVSLTSAQRQAVTDDPCYGRVNFVVVADLKAPGGTP
jgi:Tfp pilus assembly protein PilN